MGLREKIFGGGDDLPQFELGVPYYNHDYEGVIEVVSRKPFLVSYDYMYEGETVQAPRELYRKKLKSGKIERIDAESV